MHSVTLMRVLTSAQLQTLHSLEGEMLVFVMIWDCTLSMKLLHVKGVVQPDTCWRQEQPGCLWNVQHRSTGSARQSCLRAGCSCQPLRQPIRGTLHCTL